MKSILAQEKDRTLYHKYPNKFSVHRSSLLVSKIKGLKSKITFLNHFVIKRNNYQVSLKISAYNKDGRCIDTYYEELKERKVYNFDLDLYFFNQKNLIISYQVEFFSSKNLFIPYPAVIVEHVSERSHNVVHSFNRVLNDSEEDIKINSIKVKEAAIEYFANEKYSSSFVFHNGQKECNDNLKIIFHSKNKLSKKNVPIKLKPFGTKLVLLKDYIPKTERSIKKIVTVEVPKQDFFYGRLLTGVISNKNKQVDFGGNHSFYDSSNIKEYFQNNDAFMLYPFFENYQNKLTFYPINSKSNLEVSIMLPNKRKIFCGNIKSPSYEILEIDVNEIFKKNKIKTSLYEIRVKNLIGKIPTRINHQYIVANRNKSIKASISNSLINIFVYQKLVNKNGFSWGPILINKDYYSFLSIQNYSFNCDKNSFKLDIYSNLGKIYSKSFNLNKNKQLILDNSKLLKLKNKSGEMCWYTITSKKNNIHAFSFHENKKSGSISGEHSF